MFEGIHQKVSIFNMCELGHIMYVCMDVCRVQIRNEKYMD